MMRRDSKMATATGRPSIRARVSLLSPAARRSYVFAPIVLGLLGFLTLLPFTLWNHSKVVWGSTAVISAGILTARWVAQKPAPDRDLESFGVVLITAFLLYITILPKLDGSHTPWVAMIPPIWAIWLLTPSDRRGCHTTFALLFSASVIPSIALSLWMIAGGSVTFEAEAHPNFAMAAHGTRLLSHPMGHFIEGNTVALPSGGSLGRICGYFDEPGMVGTISALLLAAEGFRVNRRSLIVMTAGLLSFSLAFIVIAALGFLVSTFVTRRVRRLLPLIPVALSALLALGVIPMQGDASADRISVREGDTTERSALNSRLRHETANNRSVKWLGELITEWKDGGPATVLFGLGSNAASVETPLYQGAPRLLTDFGLVGALLLVAGAACVAFSIWCKHAHAGSVFLFFAAYALSAYQQPFIWFTYAALILFSSSVYAANVKFRETAGAKGTVG